MKLIWRPGDIYRLDSVTGELRVRAAALIYIAHKPFHATTISTRRRLSATRKFLGDLRCSPKRKPSPGHSFPGVTAGKRPIPDRARAELIGCNDKRRRGETKFPH